jgi:hypothetical protein
MAPGPSNRSNGWRGLAAGPPVELPPERARPATCRSHRPRMPPKDENQFAKPKTGGWLSMML